MAEMEEQVQLDEEAKRLMLEQIKAEARRKIAEEKKATLTAQLPSLDAKPLEGKVDVGSNVGLVAQLVAHLVLHEAANKITEKLKYKLSTSESHLRPSVLIVENRNLIATDWPYIKIHNQLCMMETALNNIKNMLEKKVDKKPEEKPDEKLNDSVYLKKGATFDFLPGLPIAIGAAASIIGMFRSDYSITGKDVKIGTTPLVAAVAHALIKENVPVSIDGFNINRSQLIEYFFKVRELRLQVEHLCLCLKMEKVQLADRILGDLRAELKEAMTAYYKHIFEIPGSSREKENNNKENNNTVQNLKDKIEKCEKNTAPHRALIAAVESLITVFDGFAVAITSATTPDAYPPIVAAAIRERLHPNQLQVNAKTEVNANIEMDTNTHTHVLFVDVEGSGGETITKKSYLHTIGGAGFLGRAQISYLLLDVKSNAIVAANTEGRLHYLKYSLDRETGPVPI